MRLNNNSCVMVQEINVCPCPFEEIYVGICAACQRRILHELSDVVKVQFGEYAIYHFRYINKPVPRLTCKMMQ